MVFGVGVGPGGEVVAAAPEATAISAAARIRKDRRPIAWGGRRDAGGGGERTGKGWSNVTCSGRVGQSSPAVGAVERVC